MDLKSTYNKIANDWFREHREDTWWQEGTDKFLAELPQGATILDVGCGAGVKSRYLAEKGFQVTGVDFSEKMIEIAKRESPDLHFEVWDLYEIDKYPKNFDGIFAQAVLLHVPKKKIHEILLKLKSKIKSGGFVCIAVKGPKEDGLEETIKKENDYGYEYERFFSYFTQEEMTRNLKEIGMEIVWEKSIKAGRATWVQILGKKT